MVRERAKRTLRKKCVVYCEGQTERNYVDGLKGWARSIDPSVEIAISPVDVKGGGYRRMLDVLKRQPDSNCVARVVMLDFDRFLTEDGEKAALKEIVAISKASAKRKVPVVLVLSNSSFEYPLCCHDPRYTHGSTAKALKSWGYGSLKDCKSDPGIWRKCNSGGRSLGTALEKLGSREPIVRNALDFKRGSASPVSLKAVDFREDRGNAFCSNLADLVSISTMGAIGGGGKAPSR